MGEAKVSKLSCDEQKHEFVKALLQDINSMEYMLENGWFEEGVTCIGAEQEMVLVDGTTYKPRMIAMDILDKMKDAEWVESELAQFNLETNLTPRKFTGTCLSEMHTENKTRLNEIESVLNQHNAHLVLTGILPTLRKQDLNMENLTPEPRYKALMDSIDEQHNYEKYKLKIMGIDELRVTHDSPLLEACNTSFQVHLQVSPSNFVQMYNFAQALAGPIIAISSNSPLVFGKRLWHESRIAMFQQSIDTRRTKDHLREQSPRVSFGKSWLKDSVMEIYKEDIARFRTLLSSDVVEDSAAMIQDGKVPKLRALQVHNGTIYRWNRPCYGISANGKPHLRIENRVLPSGPTVMDEVANATFWLGLMIGLSLEIEDITEHMNFAYARDNFSKASRYGLDSKLTWLNNEVIPARTLILEKLLPIARKGLEHQNVDPKDIDTYLGIIEGRASTMQTGSRWMIKAYSDLIHDTSRDQALSLLTSCIMKYQKSSTPVHEWEMPSLQELNYNPVDIKVSEFMIRDLFTVRKHDLLQFVGEMMQWKNLRYTLVEDKNGNLIGLITDKMILRHVLKNPETSLSGTVEDIMVKDVRTISPEADINTAMDEMRKYNVGCLPVVQDQELVGLITVMEFLQISTSLIQRLKASRDNG